VQNSVAISALRLTDDQGRPGPLGFAKPIAASALAAALGLKIHGPDRLILRIGHPANNTGINGSIILEDNQSLDSTIAGAIVITQQGKYDMKLAAIKEKDITAIVYPANYPSQSVSVEIAKYLYWHCGTELLARSIHPSASISELAFISESVVISKDVYVAPFAVVGPNSYLGPGSSLKPRAVIGSRDQMSSQFPVLPTNSFGGVWLADNSAIGAASHVAAGCFGTFTFVGSQTKVDNLVSIGSTASIERECSIVACSILEANVTLKKGVWLGPNVTVKEGVTINKYAYLGSGSWVCNAIPAFTWAAGVPARAFGIVCRCKKKLLVSEHLAHCNRCHETYRINGSQVTPVKSVE